MPVDELKCRMNGFQVQSSLHELKRVAEVRLPTPWATFRMMGFEAASVAARTGTMYPETALALILGDVQSAPPLVRIHSQCATGDIFHSLRCDCHDQLHLALERIAAEGAGILLYEHQEGRGIGLMEKLRAYALQDEGFDTIEANLKLGHAADARDYLLPVRILHFLKISRLRLMTNNPDKIEAVTASGIEVIERVPAVVMSTPHSAHYLAVKRERMGHLYAADAHHVQAAWPIPGAADPGHGVIAPDAA